MRNVYLVLAAIAASVVLATPLQAQTSETVQAQTSETAQAPTSEATQAQTAKPASCDDIQWRDERIAKSCVAVIDRNGKRYVKLSGKVTKKDKDFITVLLDHSKEKLLWAPDLGEKVSIDGKDVEPMSVAIGQPLRFYVPEAQVSKNPAE
jgi:hypothetical protein